MMTGNPLLVLIVAGALAFLAIVQFWLATRHDHAVSIQGPLESLRTILARIDQKRALLTDLEHELQERRKALAVVSDIQSEVDSLTRKRDQLLDEWAQSEERRTEVQAIRREIEEAQIDKLRLEGELAAAKAEHDEVRDRLARAERLLDQVDAMKEEHSELTGKIEELRPELRRLEEAQERVDRLAEHARNLEVEMARLEGATASRQGQLAEMEEAARSGRAAVAGVQEDLTRAQAQLAAADVERKALDAQISRLKDTRAALEARIAVLEDKIKVTAGGAAGDDPLRELKTEPQVVSVLRSWKEAGVMEENDALHRVQLHFQAAGLAYPERTLRAFHTAMKVNESTQMAVLAGISGTGKSQLPRQYAAGMGIGFLQVPVQPRWDSPQDLMGFYNYIEGRFRPTDMARALWALDELNNPEGALRDRMLMILLDEMNLARVEYYFSDFLSRLESRPAPRDVGDKGLRKDAEIELEIPKAEVRRIFPGYNLLFAGTMNEDESTQSLSDKVVDRANVIRFAAPIQIVRGAAQGQRPPTEALRRSAWERWSKAKRTEEERNSAQSKIESMVKLMRDLGRPFGHRLGRAMLAYVDRYPVTEGVPNIVNHALADQVEMRLLPKLRGVEVEAKANEMGRLQSFVADLGDDPLAHAIGQSVEAAAATGQFVWQGVTR